MDNEKEIIILNDVAGSSDYIVSATNTATGSPPSNAQTDIMKNRVISTGLGTWYLTFTNAVTTKNVLKAIVLLNINTNNWDQIQAQGSNDNFATVPSSTDRKDLTIKTRELSIFDENKRKIVDNTRHDAYAFVDNWEYNDYRIKLISTAPGITNYQIGRAYLARSVYEVEKSGDKMQPGDLVTVSTVIGGESGQNIRIPRYQQFNYALNFKGIKKGQADILTKEVAANQLCCYFVDGIIHGELFAGTFTMQQRTVFGRTFGPDTIMLQDRKSVV